MQKLLPIDSRIAINGNERSVEQAETILLKSIPQLPNLPESQARLRIQDCLDHENIKADILFAGNSVWSKKRILRDIRKVKKQGMEKLSDYLYKFLSLSCGSIAHYDRYGWIACYPTINDLRKFFMSNEFGESVLEYLPTWNTDAQQIVKAIEQELGV